MNILFITVRSDYGGGPRHIDQLINLLPPSYTIYIACPQKGEPYSIKWGDNNRIKKIMYIPYRKFSCKVLFELRKFVLDNEIGIIHSHGNGAGIYSRLLKIIYPKIKVIHTFHGISDNYSSKMKFFISYIIGQLLAPFANKYIAVSNGEKNMAIKRKFSNKTNTVVIYNGIEDTNAFSKTEMQSPIRIVSISRFDYQKNMDSFFRIATAVKKIPIQFIWVGDGEDKNRLESLSVQNNINIKFIGFSKTPMKYLKESDWYMSTSRFEGLPYALIEAASVGLPIIASDVKGNNEVAINGYNGYLFKSEEEAINIIKNIVNGSFNYKKLSENSITLFKEHFSDARMISKLIKLYQYI